MGRPPELSPPAPAAPVAEEGLVDMPAGVSPVGELVGVPPVGVVVGVPPVGVLVGGVVVPALAAQVWVNTNLSASPVIVAVAAVSVQPPSVTA
jgi:hypothetical protein